VRAVRTNGVGVRGERAHLHLFRLRPEAKMEGPWLMVEHHLTLLDMVGIGGLVSALLVCGVVSRCNVAVKAFASTIPGLALGYVTAEYGLPECKDRVKAYAKANICVN
jgi:hypothetical protein